MGMDLRGSILLNRREFRPNILEHDNSAFLMHFDVKNSKSIKRDLSGLSFGRKYKRKKTKRANSDVLILREKFNKEKWKLRQHRLLTFT